MHSLPLRGTDLSYGAILVVAVDDMSCELLKVKALSAPRQLPSRHRVLHHLVIHQLLTLTVEA